MMEPGITAAPSESLSVTTDRRIAKRLEVLTLRHPELCTLVETLQVLPEGIAMTDAFVKEYHTCTIPYAKKALVLRALFDDPSLAKEKRQAVFTINIAKRFLVWITTEKRISIGHGSKEDIPKSLNTLFRVARTTDIGFINDALMGPAWEAACKKASPCPPNTEPGAFDVLAPLIEWRTITRDDCIALLGTTDQRHIDWYFHTNIPALNHYNFMVYLDQLFLDRNGGREQNKIPLEFSRRFNTAHRSVPHALAIIDLITLAHDNLIDFENVEDDFLGLAEIAHYAWPDGLRSRYEIAVQSNAGRYLLTPDTAHAIAGKAATGVHDTTLMFNIVRGYQPDKKFADYASYYRAIDKLKLGAWIHDRTSINELKPLIPALAFHPKIQDDPIRIRDFANIVGYRIVHGDDCVRTLPAVAKFAIGVTEYVDSSSRTEPTRKNGKARKSYESSPGTSELEALLNYHGNAIAVIKPGYCGPLPPDIPTMMPRVFQGTYQNVPAGIFYSGNPTIPWGEDPYSLAINPEWDGLKILWLEP